MTGTPGKNDAATKKATLDRLQSGRSSDEQLDRAVLMSLYSNAQLTCQFMLEDPAVRHRYHHLTCLRNALKL